MRSRAPDRPAPAFLDLKAANAIRPALASLLGVPDLYALDRLDLTVHSTLDDRAQREVTRVLERLADPDYTAAAGLQGPRLLDGVEEGPIIASFALYERGRNGNILRVQADNYDQPLNFNELTRLELGSTAKLRTLVTYLEIVAELHARYAGLSAAELARIETNPDDRLTRWAIAYLAGRPGGDLPAMLDAALHRTYSANPGEIFYTGGAPHRFANFDARDNAQSLTVRDAFRRSVNLPFIRLMRDLVSYHVAELVGPVSPLQDPDDPRRQGYLEQFADWEGRVFLKRFYDRYRAADDPLEQLAARVGGSPARLAAVHRFVYPGPDFRRFCAWVIDHAADRPPSYLELAELFGRYWVRQMNLHDRAYVAGVHPLELWLVAHLTHHRDARLAEIAAASGDARREAYRWLFAPHRTRAQDRRIRVMLEQEAFAAIHTRWRRLGYPFDALVPSYATAIGSSGDSPAALAQLLGILLRDGLHYPTVRIERLRFAEHTPYERILRRRSPLPERVLLPDVAAAVRRELYGVVESGTGRRAARAVVLSDGAMLPVGGKTGTGDNRAYDSAVARSESSARVISRTAAFAFIVDDRFYGVVTVYVPGEEAGRHQFTSALPVQLFGHVAPSLAPLFEQGPAQIDMPRLVPKGSKRP